MVDHFPSQDVVIVIPHYRLGLFSTFWVESTYDTLGNYFLHDLITALKWINREIPRFGGNPNEVRFFQNLDLFER